ncbi:MAG: hypothetical protein PHR56_04310 [Dehalococcoidales bacterium]|nr:hypothetical protein [Dehalococcoidales bacterium]
MAEIKLAITAVEFIIGAVVAVAVGDYLGYKLGRMKLATILGIIALAVVVLFTIYAAITLNQ